MASRACLRRSPTQTYAASLAALLKEAALGLIEALAPAHKIADALADKAAWQPQGSPAETQQELLARLLLPIQVCCKLGGNREKPNYNLA